MATKHWSDDVVFHGLEDSGQPTEDSELALDSWGVSRSDVVAEARDGGEAAVTLQEEV